MNVHRVILVNVGTDPHVSSIANDGSFPALGVVSLATVLQRHYPSIEVIPLDGQALSMERLEQIIRSTSPDVVGLSVLSTSYLNSLRLARIGKDVGAVTIMGNDQAAVMARQILRNRPEVDYICTADVGEYCFVSFVDFLTGKIGVESVPQLAYRRHGEVVQNYGPELPVTARRGLSSYVLDQIPIPERKLLSDEHWQLYLERYLSRYGRLHESEVITGITTMNRARGCARVKQPCTFCGIRDLNVRFSSPSMFWQDVEAGMRDVSASIFYEAFDSFSSAPAWLERVAAAKPSSVEGVKFFVYTQAAETTPRLVELYKRIGVYRVNMGLESGDTGMLRRLKGPLDSAENNRRACRLLKEAGIPIYGSLVLGGPGETYESLQNTIAFGRWLIDNDVMAALEAQPISPDLHAATGRWMLNPEAARQAAEKMDFSIIDPDFLEQMPAKYADIDIVDGDEFSRDFNRIFCHVAWEDLIAATAAITDYARRYNTVAGSGKISEAQVQQGRLVQQRRLAARRRA